MRLILTVLLLFCMSCPGFSYQLTSYSPVSSTAVGNSYPQVSNLEKIILKKTYEKEDISSRLNRLEQKLCATTYPNADLSWRVENIRALVDKNKLYNISQRKLNALERDFLGVTYPKDTTENRIARLEKEIFGATQSGKLDSRYEMLLGAVSEKTTFPLEESSSLSFKEGLKNFFTQSYITGTTPPIAPYGYNSPYGFNKINGINTYYNPSHYNGAVLQQFNPNNRYRYCPMHGHFHPQPANYPSYYRKTYTNPFSMPSCSCGVHILE